VPDVVDDASPLYTRAVRAALAAADFDDPAWRRFLARVDNDADRAVTRSMSDVVLRNWNGIEVGRLRATGLLAPR
jgi:hypothetical protein